MLLTFSAHAIGFSKTFQLDVNYLLIVAIEEVSVLISTTENFQLFNIND